MNARLDAALAHWSYIAPQPECPQMQAFVDNPLFALF